MPHISIKRLKRLIKKLALEPLPPPDTSRISRLPLELLLLISDQLPIESQCLFSRTCRRVHYSLQRDWPATIRKLPPDERIRCLLLLAYDLPDCTVCGTCYKLYEVDKGDTPGASKSWRHGCLLEEDWRYVETQCGDYDSRYILAQDHVQLVLKYSRLGVRKEHLEALMKPWSLPVDKMERDIGSRYDIKCTQTPRITRGRFLHESVWEARCRNNGPVHGHQVASTWPRIYSHIYVLFYGGVLTPGRNVNDPLFPGVRAWQTFVAPETLVRSFWCRICRVEFRFEIGYNRWALKCWMDLGTETEPVRRLERWRMPFDWRYEHDREAMRPVPGGPGPIEIIFNSGGGGWAEGHGNANRIAS